MIRLAALSLFVATPAFAGDVDHVPSEFQTIQDAVDYGTAPVIQVAAGAHRGAMLTRTVTISGDPGAVIDRGLRARGARLGIGLTSDASGSEITGLTFDCTSRKLELGVFGSTKTLHSAADSVAISQNSFIGCMQGVTNAGNPTESCSPDQVDGGAYWVIEDNRFTGFQTANANGGNGGGIGVVLFNAQMADVVNNEFDGRVNDTGAFATAGVSIAGCKDCTIAANTFAVEGGTHYWSAIANNGYYQAGAAGSSGLVIADNDASQDSAPMARLNFRSFDSVNTEFNDNVGMALVDHEICGDGELALIQ